MLTTDYDRTEELPGSRRGLVAGSARRGHRSGALVDLPAVRPAGGRRDGAAARDDHAAGVARARARPTRSACATSPSGTSRTSGCWATRCSRRSTSRSSRASYVPVGEDQVSHLEIVREIVRRFNRLYGEVLLEPQALLSETPLIPGSDGARCRSRSTTPSASATSPTTIRAKVRSFITDPQKVRRGDPGRPEICPIFALHRRFSPGGRRPRRGDLPDRRARLRRLQDDPGRSPDRGASGRSASGAPSSRRSRLRRPGARRRAPQRVRPVARKDPRRRYAPRCISHERARARATAAARPAASPSSSRSSRARSACWPT